jgi:hypothetical protein
LPLCSSSSGDWPDRYARPLRYNTTITIKIQTLRTGFLNIATQRIVAHRQA